MNTQFRKGVLEICVLKLISKKDMYGYEMIDTLAQRSNNVFEMRAGTLYPLLRNLVNQKCLTSYEEEVNGKLRKYYSLTLIGRKVLEEKQKTWHEYSSAVISVIGNA
jgi:DNA-binding PadR family transcriptional regulator